MKSEKSNMSHVLRIRPDQNTYQWFSEMNFCYEQHRAEKLENVLSSQNS